MRTANKSAWGRRGIYRAVPVPPELVKRLDDVHNVFDAQTDPMTRVQPLWNWGRTTAWKHVKFVMLAAKVGENLAMPRAARHAFGVNAVQSAVALNVVQRWMGHARIETTAIYADVMGKEEYALARRTWMSLGKLLNDGNLTAQRLDKANKPGRSHRNCTCNSNACAPNSRTS